MKRLSIFLFSALMVFSQPLAAQWTETPVWPPPQDGDILKQMGFVTFSPGPFEGALNYGPAYAGFGPMFTMYCGDYYHTQGPEGSTWPIYSTGLGMGADLSRTRLADLPYADAMTKYKMAVWLATKFNGIPLNLPGSNWKGVGTAIWAVLTKPTDPQGADPGSLWGKYGYNGAFLPGDKTDPDYWLAQVTTAFAGGAPAMDYQSWYVMTAQNTWIDGVEFRNHYQEFLVHTTPEPATVILLLSGLLAVGVGARRRRNQVG